MELARILSGAGNSGGAVKTYIEDVFAAVTYTGGYSQTIANGLDLLGKGGMVWMKNLARSSGHAIYDTTRDTTSLLTPSGNQGYLTSAAANQYNGNAFSFLNNGFSLAQDSSNAMIDYYSEKHISWSFRKAAKFFDVFTYTGDGAPTRTLSHSLGSVPGFIVVKRTDSTSNWRCFHRSLGGTQYIELNSLSTPNAYTGAGIWSTGSSTITIDANVAGNASGGTYVVYLFAHDVTADGLIQCGSFTTDANGKATVELGWEPQWMLHKATTASGGWRIYDTMREMSWNQRMEVQAQSQNQDQGPYALGVTTPTGFTSEGTFGANATVIYVAIRRGPMRKPTSGYQVFQAALRTGNYNNSSVGTTVSPDLLISAERTQGGGSNYWGPVVFDRTRGRNRLLRTVANSAETSPSDALTSFEYRGYTIGTDSNAYMNVSGNQMVDWLFRRWPEVFDIVAYTGDGASTRNIAHNLKAIPHIAFIKARTTTTGWAANMWNGEFYARFNGNAFTTGLPSPVGASTLPGQAIGTDTTLRVGEGEWSFGVNVSGQNYIAYLFGTLAGISKVGNFTGNGTSQTINCGFTGGAQFVMIKNVTSAGNWAIFDTARGIAVGADSQMSLNSTNAEVSSYDSIDPGTGGFTIKQVAGGNLNINANNYIYIAIA